MASIETVVQNADAEMADDSKPDSTAEVKEEPGKKATLYLQPLVRKLSKYELQTAFFQFFDLRKVTVLSTAAIGFHYYALCY